MNKTKYTNDPKIIYCDKHKEELYDKLLKEKLFSGKQLPTVFVMAMALGFYKDRRIPLKKKKDKTRIEYFDEQQNNVIKAVAVVTEKNLEILTDKKQVYSIAEEYANGGIDILNKIFFGDELGSPEKKLESDLRGIVNDIIKK